MSRITVLVGMLAVLVAAGATLAFEITKPEVAQQLSARAEPIDQAILTRHLENLRGETALP
jgi:hypothetical protein